MSFASMGPSDSIRSNDNHILCNNEMWQNKSIYNNSIGTLVLCLGPVGLMQLLPFIS